MRKPKAVQWRAFMKIALSIALAWSWVPWGTEEAEAVSSELIGNGEFDQGDNGWFTWNDAATEVTAGIADDAAMSGSNAYEIAITNGGDAEWKVQTSYAVPSEAGASYTIRFQAKASAPRSIKAGIQQSAEPYTRYMEKVFDLTQQTQNFEYTYRLPVNDPTSNLVFYLGGSNESVWIDQVSVKKEEQSALFSSFEDGDTTGWSALGDWEGATVTSVTYQAHTGISSLLAEGRKANWQGAQFQLLGLVENGHTYDFQAWVRLDDDVTEPQNVKLTLKRTQGNADSYDTVASQTIQPQTWTLLQGEFLFPEALEYQEISLKVDSDSAPGTFSYYLDDVKVAPKISRIEMDIPSLKEVLEPYFPVGAAIEPASVTADGDHQLLEKHFSSLTAENAMKAYVIHAEENAYNWAPADAIVNYAQANGMKVRGHALVYGLSTPDWFFKDGERPLDPADPADVELVDRRMKQHIVDIVTRYEGMGHGIYAWDVVNEALDEKQPDGIRRNLFYTFLGASYIEKAFQYAHEADMADGTKDIKLFYNDFMETDPARKAVIIKMLKDFKQRGIPIDGMGMQTHIGLDQPTSKSLSDAIDQYAETGVEVQITELDLDIYDRYQSAQYQLPREADAAQGYRLKELFAMFRQKAEEGKLTGVTFWGIYDGKSWLNMEEYGHGYQNAGHPLLFDRDYKAKQAYWGIVDPSKLSVLTREAGSGHGTPVLDCQTDLIWNYLRQEQLAGGMAGFHILWDSGHLYVLASVKDTTKDPSDQLELFIDPNNTKSDGLEPDDLQITIKRDGTANQDGVSARVLETETGYIVEASIAINALLLEEGKEIGFDLRVTQGDTVTSWNDPLNSQERGTANYGTLQLQKVKTAQAVRAVTPPVIDGNEEELWGTAQQIETATQSRIDASYTTPASGVFKTMWDENYLYVLAKVKDIVLNNGSPNAYEQDSVEVFVDENNGKTESFEASGDAQYRVNYMNSYTYNGMDPNQEIISEAKKTDDGYVVEMRIKLQSVKGQKNTLMGYDVQVNDADASAARKSIRTWSGANDTGYRSTSDYGVLQFLPAEEDLGTDPEEVTPSATVVLSPALTWKISKSDDGLKQAAAVVSDTLFKQKLADRASNTVTMDLTPSDMVDEVLIQLPGEAFAWSEENGAVIEFTYEGSKVIIPPGTVTGINKAKPILLSIRHEPSAEIKEWVEGAPRRTVNLSGVYEFSLTSEDRPLKAAVKPIIVRLPFEPRTETKHDRIGVYALSTDDMKWKYVKGHVSSNRTFEIGTEALAKYAVIEFHKGFSDIARSYAEDAIEALASKQIVQGKEGGRYSPHDTLTRAEFVSMLARAAGVHSASLSQSFTDVPAGKWYAKDVNAAAEAGWITGGGDGSFLPEQIITREEMAVMAVKALLQIHPEAGSKTGSSIQMFKDETSGSLWAVHYIDLSRKTGILSGSPEGLLAPRLKADRAQAAVLLHKWYQAVYQ
ncbi:endo-1,4-beta-xylanase [Paenibacillus gansuensis]|uniref:Beta-xylanase n=1 Tax=Paenibacillus gansuensis TaxID=306542 RepID=A0ABW5PAP6_9BACL